MKRSAPTSIVIYAFLTTLPSFLFLSALCIIAVSIDIVAGAIISAFSAGFVSVNFALHIRTWKNAFSPQEIRRDESQRNLEMT